MPFYDHASPAAVPGPHCALIVNRKRAIDLLKQHEAEFRDSGIDALYLFGSVARNEAGETSDVDAFFDLGRPHGFTLFDLVRLQQRMRDILTTHVDLMSCQGIHPRRHPRIEADAVRVF